MIFSIRNLLRSEIDGGRFTDRFAPLADHLLRGMTKRVEREIDNQLSHDHQGRALLLKIFDAADGARELELVQDARRDLFGDDGLNNRIARAAHKLADLMRERERKERAACLVADSPYALDHLPAPQIGDDIVGLIEFAAEYGEAASSASAAKFEAVLQDELATLNRRFFGDWPPQADLVDAIGEFAEQRQYASRNLMGRVATIHRQRNLAGDFVRLLKDGIRQIAGRVVGGDSDIDVIFPEAFTLTDECRADLVGAMGFGTKSAKEIRQFMLGSK